MSSKVHHARMLKMLHAHLGATVIDTYTPAPPPPAPYKKRKNRPDENHLTIALDSECDAGHSDVQRKDNDYE